jgi:hypothetical protein
MPKRRGDVHLTVRLERTVYRALAEAATTESRNRGRMISMNTIIRQAVAAHLGLDYEPQPRPRGPRPRGLRPYRRSAADPKAP